MLQNGSLPVEESAAGPAPLAEQIASVYADGAPIPVSGEAVDKVKTCLFDLLACALIARDLDWSRAAVQLATESTGVANIVGTAHAVSPSDAAFANAVAAHGLVQEDMHAGAVSHLGVVVLPLLLALSQRTRASGVRWIEAAVVGYEVGAQIGRAIVTPEIARLFRPTGITGPLAGAAAGSRMLGFDLSSATSALALAANTTAGLNEWPSVGGSDMFFHPGWAARSAYSAVVLAEAGSYGSPRALDGEAGLFMSLQRARKEIEIRPFAPGRPLELMAVYNKALPVCNFAQTAAQAALAIAADASPDPRDIRTITIRVAAAAKRYPGCDFAGHFDRVLQAKMSIQFAVATALLQGKIDESSFTALNDHNLVDLLGKMELTEDPRFTRAFPGKQGAEVEVVLAAGHRLVRTLEDVRAATHLGIRERFNLAAANALGEGRKSEIVDFINRLEEAGSVGELGRMLST